MNTGRLDDNNDREKPFVTMALDNHTPETHVTRVYTPHRLPHSDFICYN